jgi:hypothetical protein
MKELLLTNSFVPAMPVPVTLRQPTTAYRVPDYME